MDHATLHQLVRRYRPQVHAIDIEPIATGKFNHSYWVQADNEALVLRVAPPRDSVFVFYERGMMRQEPQIHALVLAETAVPVPRILGFDDSHRLIEQDYMLMARLPGRPLSEMTHVSQEQVLAQVGEMVAQVHRLHATRHGYLGPHRPMPPQPHWVDAFMVMWHKLIGDIAAVGDYDEEECLFLKQLLEKYLPLFDHPVWPACCIWISGTKISW